LDTYRGKKREKMAGSGKKRGEKKEGPVSGGEKKIQKNVASSGGGKKRWGNRLVGGEENGGGGGGGNLGGELQLEITSTGKRGEGLDPHLSGKKKVWGGVVSRAPGKKEGGWARRKRISCPAVETPSHGVDPMRKKGRTEGKVIGGNRGGGKRASGNVHYITLGKRGKIPLKDKGENFQKNITGKGFQSKGVVSFEGVQGVSRRPARW